MLPFISAAKPVVGALHLDLQEVVDAGAGAGVGLLFAPPCGHEVAAVVAAAPWSSSAPAASTIGRECFDDWTSIVIKLGHCSPPIPV